MASRADWQKILRKTIKLENGEGWYLRGIEIKGVLQTQVTLRHREDGRRETTFIPYEWNSRNQTKITTAVAELKRLIDDRNLTIKEAEKFRLGPSEEGSAASVLNWFYENQKKKPRHLILNTLELKKLRLNYSLGKN